MLRLLFILFCTLSLSAQASSLRSFIATPIEPGGAILRVLNEYNQDTETNQFITSLAYGISATQTVFFRLPYRTKPSRGHQTGDFAISYRHLIHQSFTQTRLLRVGLLAGVVLPTDNDREERIRIGAVMTRVSGRHEFDADLIWTDGLGNSADSARYDLSWQYRISPTKLPEWDPVNQINTVVELGGRWRDGNTTVHQLTLGLQWISQRIILEGGVVQDINGPHNTRYLVGARFRF